MRESVKHVTRIATFCTQHGDMYVHTQTYPTVDKVVPIVRLVGTTNNLGGKNTCKKKKG